MKIMPESIIEAFQKSENFSFGARTIDFYVKLGFPEKDIREAFGKGNMPVSYEDQKYVIGLTKDKDAEYVTIIPEEIIELPHQARKLGKEFRKQVRL